MAIATPGRPTRTPPPGGGVRAGARRAPSCGGAAAREAAGLGWEAAGPVTGEPIIFLHGAVMTRSQWCLQVERFAAAGYRCISVDLPGHGVLADQPFTMDAAVQHVTEVIDRVAGGRAVLVGLSLGGYVAMTLAGRSPARVRGLVLAGSTHEPGGPSRAAFWFVGTGLGIAPEPILRAMVGWLWTRRYGPDVTRVLLAKGYYARGGGAAIRVLAGGGFRERLRAYGGPVLVINGNLDLPFRLGEERFLEGVDGVTRRRLAWAAHLSNLDRPEDFSNEVEGFIQALAP
ncbi:MAG TPA: alpha/beta hydrolase [Candidatus Limnocylindrales bacterium]|nr:alpha/beta hydrolase [Candidatus Limnocylindrales bacterium]